MKLKILVSVLCLILISSLCFAKVYQDPQGLFQLDLPSGWEFVSSQESTYFFSVQRDKASATLMVSIIELPQDIDLSTLSAAIENDYLKIQPAYTKFKEEKITFASIPAIYRVYTINDGKSVFVDADYYFIKDRKAYWVQMATHQSILTEFEKDFQQIRQSFSLEKETPKLSFPTKPTVKEKTKTSGEGEKTKKFEGLEMIVYTAPDKSFSMYYPKGWVVNLHQMGVSIQQNPNDELSTAIDIFPLQFGEMSYTSLQIVQNLAGEMKKQYPDFNIVEAQKISEQPDLRGILFNYTANNVKFGGFGIAISQSNQGMFVDIYGKEDSFTTYNPAMVLSYVLQSLNQGEKPNEPKIEIPKEVAEKSKEAAPKQGSDEYYKKKTRESMMGAHMWNMMPYIAPDAFQPLIW